MKTWITIGSVLAAALAVAATAQSPSAAVRPERWPKVAAGPALNSQVEDRVTRLIAAMSLEDKVGQLIQADIATITPDDLKTYKLGSVLNGGNSAPGNDELAPPIEWLKLADAFYDAAMARSDGRPRIPPIWGTDAVHGNNNIVGATLFPHNIGLGAARDPDLIETIGRITAEETAAAGLDWSFAPTLAVARDDRWGRTYESYSEDSAIVASYAGRVVTGLQGKVATSGFLSPGHVISTAKHFVGDGGTLDGRDQGDARIAEAKLREIHAAGYPPALAAGTLTVMASFSSWNGAKMTANRSLLTGLLKERWGFPGFVVGDWNGHGQVPGCTVESCPAAINAGLDMFMVSGNWKALYANTLAQARSGEIPRARLDDAVRRILRVKFLAGVFSSGRPSSRPFAGQFDKIGSAAAKAVARRAVRESLVLLKNNNGVLPLRAKADILVAGRAADTIAQAAGGWSITWQGTGVANSGFPNATSIWRGIRDAVSAAGGTAHYAPDGTFSRKPDIAIVVFGEEPYAEFMGDRPTLEYSPADKRDLALLRRMKAAGIPVVAVFLSGRPLWVNPELNASDAFIAAFLPGSEGGGVADMLFGAHGDFRGRLSFSWPRRPDQYALNRGDPGYDPLFPLGYGLGYASRATVPQLDETRPPGMDVGLLSAIFGRGRVPDGWILSLAENGAESRVTGSTGRSLRSALTLTSVDRAAQEDARQLSWTGERAAELRIAANRPVDMDIGQAGVGEVSLRVDYRVDAPPAAVVTLAIASAGGRAGVVSVTDVLRRAPIGAWQTLTIPLRCFTGAGFDPRRVERPFAIASAGRLTLSISDVAVTRANAPTARCGGW